MSQKRVFKIMHPVPGADFGCVRLGNPDLDFQNLRIRIRCSREQFSKSFFRFPNRTTKSEIQKIRIWISLLKSTLRTDFSEVKSVFGFRDPDFQIERTLHISISSQPTQMFFHVTRNSDRNAIPLIICAPPTLTPPPLG